MSSGPKNVTSTTNSEPPAFLLGPLTTAANAAQNSFLGQDPRAGGGGGGRIVPGGRRGFRDGQPTGPGGVLPTGGNTSGSVSTAPDLIGQSQDLTSRTLAGDFLNPDSNPFLQGTFNRAADLTRTRLSSEFAGAGRDLGAALPARSEELQTLASTYSGRTSKQSVTVRLARRIRRRTLIQ